MSGLTNQHQSITSRPLSSSAPNMSDRNHDRRQRNPFVHSGEGGTRSRGNSHERVNSRDRGNNNRENGNKGNQGAKSHHGPIIEKRDKKERSHVFSK